jgi:hypothetical protein
MLRILVRSAFVAVAFVAFFHAAPPISNEAQAVGHHRHPSECRGYEYGNPDLFYNFYVPPTCGGVGAQMYLAPVPVPPLVGHTYFTYQPLMPHEFLYRHHRRYHRYYNEGRGLTRTSVIWW